MVTSADNFREGDEIIIETEKLTFIMEDVPIENTFLKLKLKPDISGFNVISVMIIMFVVAFIFAFILMFSPFILEDPNYYNVPKDKVGRMMGNIGFVTQVCVILGDLSLGTIMDVFGRKMPTCIGIIIASTALIAIPYGTQPYVTFLILRTLVSVGLTPSTNIPLMPDYVYPESLGLAGAYTSCIATIGLLLGTTVSL